MSRYVKMESTSGGKMKKKKTSSSSSSSRSMDLSHVQITFPHINNSLKPNNDDDQIKKNMIVKNEEARRFSTDCRHSNAAMRSEMLMRSEKNASRKAKSEFSVRRYSTSERYCRVHDQNDHVHLSSSPAMEEEEDVQVEEEEEEPWRRKKKTTDKTSGGKFLSAFCKRILRF